MALLEFTDCGIYCRQADAYIDPWKAVDRALITHAHADHSRWGMKHYLAHPVSIPVMRLRLGEDISVQAIEYGAPVVINGVEFTYFPAGHIPGSAQIRCVYKGESWVVSGDYKLEADGISTPFEPVACQHFITESTFGLPVYTWQSQAEIFEEINGWWAQNAAEGRCSVIFGYSLGKAQRILKNIDLSIGPVYCHGAVQNTNEVLQPYLPFLSQMRRVEGAEKKAEYRQALIVAPPSAMGTPWMRKFAPFSTGVCSGWMTLRGAKRRRAADRGFVLSDHADWPGLNTAVLATGAEHVYATHGYSAAYARYISESFTGIEAAEVHTLFGVDDGAEEEAPGVGSE
jgi:putative mRNA 3-end processing factor